MSTGPIKKAVICSDSLSCLLAINNKQIKNPIISKTRSLHRKLIHRGKSVIFCWIPSHIGIHGNTVADREAKAALNKPICNTKIPYSDFKSNIIKYFRRLWQNEWDVHVHNKLHEIYPTTGFNSYTSSMSRHDQVVLGRCRIGHSRLTHRFILDGSDSPQCIPCNAPLSIKHILIDCVDFANTRQRFYEVNSIFELFDTVTGDVVVNFLKAIGLYHKI